MEGKGLF